MAGVALLELAPQVEHRVVDADRETDQEHDRIDRALGDREQMAERPEQAERADHRGQPEQQRDAGCDERPECEQQDQQRDRQRGELGLAEVTAEGLVERAGGARLTELLDAHARVRALGGRHHRQGHHDPLGSLRLIPGERERDQRGAAVPRDLPTAGDRQRRADVPDIAERAQAGDEIVDGGHERRAAGRTPSRPWTSTCSLACLGNASEMICVALPDSPLPISACRQMPLPDRAPHEVGDENEGQPAEDRATAVPGAPSCRARSEIGRPGVEGRACGLLSSPTILPPARRRRIRTAYERPDR